MPVLHRIPGGFAVIPVDLISVDPTVVLYPAETGGLFYNAALSTLYFKKGGGDFDWLTLSTSQNPILPSGVLQPAQGATLPNTDETVNPATDKASLYVLPAATLTANHVLTLGTGGSPQSNAVVQIERRDLTANTYTVKDDSGATLMTFASSPSGPQGASFYYSSTTGHYVFLSFYYLA